MTDETHERLVLLNRLVSRSSTRAPQEHKPPIHSAPELLKILQGRQTANIAIEFFGAPDEEVEAERIKAGLNHNFIRLAKSKIVKRGDRSYAILLIEYVDQAQRSFPVVHTVNFTGREISGDDAERGASTAHVVVRLPKDGELDDGNYRCVIEVVHSVTRQHIENFLCRQLRRHSDAQEWVFTVTTKKKEDKASKTKDYRYNPRLELFSDIGRALNLAASGGKVLSHMVFTKRSEKQSIGVPKTVVHTDVVADVELRISAKQGPDDPEEMRTWASAIRAAYEKLNYDSKMYYRHINGRIISGNVHEAVAGASDLLMCPKELISTKKPAKRWLPSISDEVADGMIALLENDGLWERAK